MLAHGLGIELIGAATHVCLVYEFPLESAGTHGYRWIIA
jgi:hypothetical protein